MAKAKKKLTIKLFENRELLMKDSNYPYYVTVTYNRKATRIKSPTWEYLYSKGEISAFTHPKKDLYPVRSDIPIRIVHETRKSLVNILTKNDERLISNIRMYHEDFLKAGIFDVALLKSGSLMLEQLKKPLVEQLFIVKLIFQRFLSKEYGQEKMYNTANLINESPNFLTLIKSIKELNENVFFKLKENFPNYFIIIDFIDDLFQKGFIPYLADYEVNNEILKPIMKQLTEIRDIDLENK